MTTIQNAGGGDYQGLPTAAIKHRGRAIPQGLPWDQINADYIAADGQVDAGVWPKHSGKVRLVESGSRGADRVHTVEERTGDYEMTQPRPAAPNRAKLSEARVHKVCLEYRGGATIQQLADQYRVSVTSIRTALKNGNEPTRSAAEAARVRHAS